jgi:hypothetical protein
MKIQSFNYFSESTSVREAQNSSQANEGDFDIDVQQIDIKNTHTSQISGDTCPVNCDPDTGKLSIRDCQ